MRMSDGYTDTITGPAEAHDSLRLARLPQLSMDALRTFVAAAEHGNFTRAGEVVNRSQSAVSMQIKRLEQDLECRLFERSVRAVRLTNDGETLLGYAQRLVRLHDEAVASMTAPAITGEVRLGVPDDYATRYLPDVLLRFARQCPGVRVEVRCDNTGALRRSLEEGELDVCLATTAIPNGAEPAPRHRVLAGAKGDIGCWDSLVLARMPLVWVGARHLDLDAIWNKGAGPLPLAVFHEGCLHRKGALEALRRADIPFRVAFASVSLAGVMAAVRTGLAVAPSTAGCVDAACRVLGPESGLPPLPAVHVTLHRRTAPAHPAADRLAQFVVECFRETGIPTV